MTRTREGRNCHRHRRCVRRDPRGRHDGGHLSHGVPEHARDDPRVRRDVRRHAGRVRHGRHEEDPGVLQDRLRGRRAPPGRARSTSSSASPSAPARTACWPSRPSSTEIEDDFTKKGMQLVVDGTDPDLVREILEVEIDAMAHAPQARAPRCSRRPAASPRRWASSAPSWASCTCSSNLDAPETLGPSISGAFIATLLGVGAANVIFLPDRQPPEAASRTRSSTCAR